MFQLFCSWCFCGFLIIEDFLIFFFLIFFFLAVRHFVGVILVVFLADFPVRQLWRASLIWQLNTDFVTYKWLLVWLDLTLPLLWTSCLVLLLTELGVLSLLEALPLLEQKLSDPDWPQQPWSGIHVHMHAWVKGPNAAVGTSGYLAGMSHPTASRHWLRCWQEDADHDPNGAIELAAWCQKCVCVRGSLWMCRLPSVLFFALDSTLISVIWFSVSGLLYKPLASYHLIWLVSREILWDRD